MLDTKKAKNDWHVAHARTDRWLRDGPSDLLVSCQFTGLNRRRLVEQIMESKENFTTQSIAYIYISND